MERDWTGLDIALALGFIWCGLGACCRFRKSKYLMKGIMVLGLLLPGADLREQLIKTAAGRLSITGWAEVAGEQSGACRPLNMLTKARSANVSSAGKDSSSLDSRSVRTLMHTHTHTHTHIYIYIYIYTNTHMESNSEAAVRHSWKRFAKMLNLPCCCPLKWIRASELLSESH